MALESGAPATAAEQRLASLGYAGKDRALDSAAREFEALFLEMLLKSARAASVGEGLLDSAQGDLYRDMFDQQMATTLGAQGGFGIANMLLDVLASSHAVAGVDATSPGADSTAALAQLRAHAGPTLAPADVVSLAMPPTPNVSPDPSSHPNAIQGPEAFAESLWGPAQRAAAELGVAPEVLLAQAALETGWGRSLPRHPDGRSSHNLFGIKAGTSWDGERVLVDTIEVEDGLPRRQKASFRAYDSYADCFEDYVRLIGHSPRYAEARARAADPVAYLHELQQAGYATDPEYASKIGRILNSEALAAALARSS